MYSDEIATWFDADGRITGPGGDGRISLSYRPELAEAIAILLVDSTHDDRNIVTITNPEAVTLTELAALATEVTGDQYRYEPLPRQEWIDYRRSLGREEWSIEAGITFYDSVVVGEADVVSDDFELLTGRSAKTIRELIELFRDEMPLAKKALGVTQAVILSAVRTPVGRYGGAPRRGSPRRPRRDRDLRRGRAGRRSRGRDRGRVARLRESGR